MLGADKRIPGGPDQCPPTNFSIRRPCPQPAVIPMWWRRAGPRARSTWPASSAQAFENLKLGLAAVGASFDHVVKVTVYFTDMANLQAYFEVRDRYVNTKAPPASTAVQISKLARDGALFEIEAIAVVPEA